MGNERGNNPQSQSHSAGTIPLQEIPLHSTNLLSLLDTDGTIRYQSRSIERLLGFSQEALVGELCMDCFHPDDRDRVYNAFKNVALSTEFVVEAIEYRHLKADGTYVWVESVASSNPTPNGYYVINTRDISKQKRQQDELERANERLEAFAGIVSHDLRNPLGVARGYLKLAQKEYPNEYFSAIDDALDRMEALIDSLLTSTRIETQQVSLEMVDLTDICNVCWANTITKDATLEIKTTQLINADRLQLIQLLENIFRNAIDHGQDDAVISVGDLEDGFYIEDDGPGIPSEDRELIFETGYSTRQNGTGLGLGIVKRIVDAHGWKLQVTETATDSARFEIRDVAVIN